MRTVTIAGALAMLVAPAAAERACFVSYAGFEEKVPHLDLDLCPGGAPRPEEGFCRIAVAGTDVLIYVFRHLDGEPCLSAVQRHDFNAFVARHGANYVKP